MIRTAQIFITPEMLMLISELDRFKGAWKLLGTLEPERLNVLRKVATIESITPDGDSHRLKIRVPQSLKKYIAPKGSVALDGISLTVNEVEDDVFGVNIIPHTWEVTTLGARKVGEKLNMEVDMLARYVARILGKED